MLGPVQGTDQGCGTGSRNRSSRHPRSWRKIWSFELYRPNTAEPEILTFDELLARADWFVAIPAL